MKESEVLSSEANASNTAWLVWMPHVLIACWLVFLAASIWQHALHSVQTPFYDPLSYYQKAVGFWRTLEGTLLFNPFNLEPSVRPPGTILMSLPFGLADDFRGFYFRSVFLPILFIVLSVYMVTGLARARASAWQVAGIAILFSSLPMFYWLDWNQELYSSMGWGMVDNFQAGIAAMAVAAILRSQMTKSQWWLLSGALLASFTLLIKPSGLMVMALTFLIWLAAITFEWIQELRPQRSVSSLRRYVLSSGIIFLLSYSSVLVLCIASSYLSRANFNYAFQALAIMRKTLANRSLLPIFHLSTGELMPLWIFVVGILLIRKVFTAGEGERRTVRMASLLFACAIVTWFAGSWYWLVVQSGESQIRYFYPFLLMGCLCVVPASLTAWPCMQRPYGLILTIVCFLPAANISALLAAGDSPSGRWQYLSGVSVSVGGGTEEKAQAYAVLEEARQTKKDLRVYFFPNSIHLETSFTVVGPYEKLMRPDLPSFSPRGPIDWVRGFAVRINEMLECDYILLNRNSDLYVKHYLSFARIDTFEAESRVFESWLLRQNSQSGLKIVSEGSKLRLLRITDRAALSNAIEQFVSDRKWRPEFTAANKPLYWDRASALAAAGNLQLQDIGFSGIYALHALAVKKIQQRIQIDIWWEELRHEEANDQRFLFFHLVDATGKIIHNQQLLLFPYTPPNNDRRWQHGSITFEGVLPDKNLKSIAFGVYQPNGPFLFPDKKLTSDWEGRRILVPLNTIADTGMQ